jgi:hypothetical protein
MIKYVNFILILIVIPMLWSCTEDFPIDNTPPSSNIAYSNSFESSKDIDGWFGLDTSFFVPEHCPGGGLRSLLIGGGCIQPTASYSMIIKQAGFYSFSCWGKSYQTNMSGRIILSNHHYLYDSTTADVNIKSDDWQYYQALNKVKCSIGDTLFISIMVGGIKYDAVYIDNLMIKK